MKIRGLFLVAVYAASGISAPGFEAVDDSQLLDAAQDSTGLVWAIPRNGGFAVFEGKRWHNVPLPGALRNAAGIAMCNSGNGKVLTLWRSGDELFLTASKGSAPEVIASFTLQVAEPRLLCDSRDRLWLTEGMQIWQVTLDGRLREIYKVSPDSVSSSVPDRLRMYEDSRGRIWFYSQGIQGVIIYDDGKFYHRTPLPAQNGEVWLLAPGRDQRHLWICDSNFHLYEIDVDTVTASRVLLPSKTFEENFCEIFSVDGKGYFLTQPGSSSPFEETGAFWRLDHDSWTSILHGFDSSGFDPYRTRPHLGINRGDLFGSFSRGIWFVSRDAREHKRLDWRYGVPLRAIDRLFKLPRDRFLAVQIYNGGSWFADLDDLLSRTPATEPEILKSLNGFVRDESGVIWGVRDKEGLSRWDGEKWSTAPFPEGLSVDRLSATEVDSDGRIWLLPYHSEGVSAMFDPGSGEWRTFPDFRKVAEALAATPLRNVSTLERLAQFGSGGRITFVAPGQQLHYFDGRSWHQWGVEDITGQRDVLLNQVRLAEDGTLLATIDRSVWRYEKDADWFPAAEQKPQENPPQPEPLLPPSTFPGRDVDSIAKDNTGAFWLIRRKGLYRAREGMWAAVFKPDSAHPFIDGRKLEQEAFIDRRGNAFLRTGDNEYVMIRPRGPLPETHISEVVVQGALVTVKLTGDAGGDRHLIWRLQGGEWSNPTQDDTFQVRFSDKGKYVLEVSALDAALQVDPTPAETLVEINIDRETQITVLIGQLGDNDFDKRQAAVDALIARGEPALGALRSARETANEDVRWWIDAAIQEIERLNETRTK